MIFRSFKEIRARPKFDPGCEITVENCDGVLGEYQFPKEEPEVPCQGRQLERPNRCNEGHRHGWLGRRKDDGREALIGVDCGNKYFRKNVNFVADTTRITDDNRINAFVDQLQTTVGSPDYEKTLTDALNRHKAVRATVIDFQRRLPRPVVNRLQQMAKSRNYSVGMKVRYLDDEDENGNPIYRWDSEQLGAIAGVAIWDNVAASTLSYELRNIRDTLPEIEIVPSAGLTKLRKWAATVSGLPSLVGQVASQEATLQGFKSRDNLRLLCFLTWNSADRLGVSRCVVEEESGLSASNSACRRLLAELDSEVKKRTRDRPFKIDA